MDSKGYYKALGVPENATQDQIKQAFRKLSLKWHPFPNKELFIGKEDIWPKN